ncbi:hypothetical protein [Saccharomonospora marina]|uniref:hypothetical protein n=1 Tax=Saccharomonospora marina TaxID=632569 RepID=UPI0002E16942|nr:hypothetical protein [Saccharomonospora marina]
MTDPPNRAEQSRTGSNDRTHTGTRTGTPPRRPTGAADEPLRDWASEQHVELDDVVAELVRTVTAALADSA